MVDFGFNVGSEFGGRHYAVVLEKNNNPRSGVILGRAYNFICSGKITPERFKALLEKYPFGTPFYIPFLLLYHTGMRISEVLGLSWDDIDFEAKKITLRRQIRYISKRGFFFTTLKTESSNRYILINNFLLGELRRWKVQQIENEKQFGDSYAT